MADSDDEYDRKRRDKFRGERSSGDSYRAERRDDRRGGGGGGVGGGRDEWSDRNPFRGGGGGGGGGRPRPDYRDYRGPRDRYGSPGREMPPTKRMRPDWGDEMRGGPRYGGYDPYLMHAWNEHYAAHSMHGGYGGGGHGHMSHPRESMGGGLGAGGGGGGDTITQPAMLTLKQFLDTQDDGISDSEVMRKYGEYKLEFKRQQLNEFFVAHKDEEWFKMKYHPTESVKRKEEQLGFLQKRVDVFNELLENGQVKAVTIDTTQTEPLLRLLDTVVIKLEGGTEDDLKILDEKPRDVASYIFDKKLDQQDDDVIITSVEQKCEEPPKPVPVPVVTPTIEEDEEPRVVSPRPLRTAVVSDDEENWDLDNDDEVGDSAKMSTSAVDAPTTPTEAIVAPPEAPEPVAVAEEHLSKKEKKKALKRKRSNSDSSSSSSTDSDASSSSSSDDDDDDDKIKSKYDVEMIKPDMDAHEEKAMIKLKEETEAKEDADRQRIAAPAEPEGDDDFKKTETASDVADSAASPAENGVGAKDTDEGGGSPKNTENAEYKDKDDSEEKTEAATGGDLMSNNDKHIDKQAFLEGDEAKAVAAADNAAAKDDADKVIEVQDKDSESVADDQPVTIDLDKEKDVPRPRALHRTSSIFLRNLAPSITKAEIEAICQRFEGYLRVAIADPLVERRWYRRGWVTFKRDVNIKEICWNLNNTRLRDCEMGAIVNRDLSRRVRPVNGMTAHKTIVRSDIKLCAKIAMNLDERFNLWDKTADDNAAASKTDADAANGAATEANTSYGFKSNNPVLQNITDFLIEEGSAEEEELLGISGEHKEVDGETIERDVQLISVLDSLVLYLRIVHSVDFYNHCEYPYEDEMPNRCGIIHARGPLPMKVAANDVQDYIKNFEMKMQAFLAKTTTVESDELKQLGCKDAESEVEKFVQANTQELAKDKWLCPLSGKKFKGPEFIRKHIFNKHAEKVDEVRKEVEFFNNYLRDPKRPQLPEHPGSNKRTNSESGGSGFRAPMYPPAFAPPYAAYAPPMMMSGRGGGRGFGGGRRPGGNEYRQLIQYRDLDAPQEPVDMFN